MGIRLVVRSPWNQGRTGEATFQFDQTRIHIGRSASMDVRLPLSTVSEHHASLHISDRGCHLVDENSTNGTWINGVRATPERPSTVRPSDRVEIGGFVLRVESGVAVGASTSLEETGAFARHFLAESLRQDQAQDAQPMLRVEVEGKEPQSFALDEQDRHVIGRSAQCDITIADPDISREHCEVLKEGESFLLRDLGSKNGVLIAGRKKTSHLLSDGDEFILGTSRFRFEDPIARKMQEVEMTPEDSIEARAPDPLAAESGAPSSEEPRGGSEALGRQNARAEGGSEERRPAPLPSSMGAEWAVYIFAITVLLISVAGLLLILRAQ